MNHRLRSELNLLELMVYKTKNQHRRTWVYKKLVLLNRLLNREPWDIERILTCCRELYILATSNLEMGHFIGYTCVILGICARIHFLISKETKDKENPKENESNIIDDIFGCDDIN
ncbi:hypothetical protein TCON_0319 [Astathelohania contejeani]|uniref:Uncharacterized protein n=1 Tax=Astathelohania contejeani TaxID=164912 RepID=A0ABQ7I275_9MICR|nr:hypothetical protein TCON_0319 [Thelohania contejeani]